MQLNRKRLACFLFLLAFAWVGPRSSQASSPTRVENVAVAFRGANLVVSVHLTGELPEDVEDRLVAGQEITFEYLVQLRRGRKSFSDKTVFQRYVVVTARLNTLTRMYSLSRRVDGTMRDSELTDRESVMRTWMTDLVELGLFETADFDEPGDHYVRVKVKLQSRFRLLFVPADLETDWKESARFDRPPSGP